MKCLRIYATPDGESHFDEIELPTTPISVHPDAVPFDVTASYPASRVRITHIPTGIAVACQAERSQHKNRAKAWEMLRSRLYEEELKRREAAANATEATKSDIGWGHQIRSYVLQPYQLVKDLRTGVESTSPSNVLDGDLDDFMEASLSQRIEGSSGQPVADLD